MRPTILLSIFLSASLIVPDDACAQNAVVENINSYGTFDRWCVREIKESGIIGGNIEYLYEFYGNQDTLRTGRAPYVAPEDYIWRTNNVLAIVAGVVKTSNTVYPEKRDEGWCARIETHIEEVKALGILDMSVTCQGAMMVGVLPEPITTTRDPMSKVLYGVPFEGFPKALRFDYKAEVGNEAIRGTGFSKLKKLGYPDYAEVTVMLLKIWEDESGEVHSLRVGTGIERIMEDAPDWINGHEIAIRYGDITGDADYQEYMGLKNDPETAYHIRNSRGRDVVIHEDGWAEEGTEPNHIMIHFLTSCGRAFYGGVGNTLWIDNVELVM